MKYALIAAVMLLAGCSTFAGDRYAVSMDAQEAIENMRDEFAWIQKIAVGDFTASTPGVREIGCRAVGPIKTPDGETYEAYVRKALIDQLRLARLYSTDGTVIITGILNEINFSSHEGMWYLDLTLSDGRGRSFNVREQYDYESSFYGETACAETAQALMPAVQNLIVRVIRNPGFSKMVSARG